MLTALKSTGPVIAANVEKDNGPYHCPSCGGAVILKKGRVYVHHFAHVPDSNCGLRGESREHMQAKWGIYQALLGRDDIVRAELEFTLPGSGARADVMFRKGKHVVAVEIQRSRLENETLLARMSKYHQEGVAVAWVLTGLSRNDDGERKLVPQKWQRLLHGLYFGRVYEWDSGLTVKPMHFSDYMLWKEGGEYFTEYGEPVSHEAYQYPSKRYKTESPGDPINLIDDFAAIKRNKWKNIPAAFLWKDTLPAWWTS